VERGSRIVRYAPSGAIDRVIELPVTNPTCPAFGGSDLRTLFITTATSGLSEAQRRAEPDAGALFCVEAGAVGLPEPRFLG
jgi:sugar lactone lactonase YvrE